MSRVYSAARGCVWGRRRKINLHLSVIKCKKLAEAINPSSRRN
jgi:hypothetical protein